MEFYVIFCWLFFMWAVGYMAHSRTRSIFGWLVLAFLISPFLAMIALLVVGDHPLVKLRGVQNE